MAEVCDLQARFSHLESVNSRHLLRAPQRLVWDLEAVCVVKNVCFECMCTVVTFSGSFWRTCGCVTRGRFYSKNLHAVFTLVTALCAAQRARWSSIRGETARDRKFGRPRTGLARARRGVTGDGADKSIYCRIRGVPPISTSHERLNVIIHCAFYHYQIIAPYLHPGISTLRKFVKNLTRGKHE